MNINVKEHADTLERRASILAHYTRRRVSHTAAGVIRCVLSIAELVKHFQTDKNFSVMLVQALKASYDPTSGTCDVNLYNDGTIWIEGSFRIDELRDRLITVPQPTVLEEKVNG